jgi:hypothetical protein
MNKYRGYVLEAVSQLLNAVLGGYPDEMLSARIYRTKHWSESWFDFLLGKDHCKNMYKYEWTRKSQHPHYSKCDT